MEYLRATRDDEMGKIGPSPSGAAKMGPYVVVGLDCGPATAFGLRLVWPIFVRIPGSPAHELCAFGWNAAHAKVNNRL